MATSRELTQSILTALTLVQNSDMSEDEMEQIGVHDMLVEMDGTASELAEVLG